MDLEKQPETINGFPFTLGTICRLQTNLAAIALLSSTCSAQSKIPVPNYPHITLASDILDENAIWPASRWKQLRLGDRCRPRNTSFRGVRPSELNVKNAFYPVPSFVYDSKRWIKKLQISATPRDRILPETITLSNYDIRDIFFTMKLGTANCSFDENYYSLVANYIDQIDDADRKAAALSDILGRMQDICLDFKKACRVPAYFIRIILSIGKSRNRYLDNRLMLKLQSKLDYFMVKRMNYGDSGIALTVHSIASPSRAAAAKLPPS